VLLTIVVTLRHAQAACLPIFWDVASQSNRREFAPILSLPFVELVENGLRTDDPPQYATPSSRWLPVVDFLLIFLSGKSTTWNRNHDLTFAET